MKTWGLTYCWVLALAAGVAAQGADDVPPPLREVDVIEHLGDTVPADLTFTDADGNTVTLGDYLDGKRPVLLNLAYHECPMLCSLLLDGLTTSLQDMDWVPGEKFDILTVSFSPTETPAQAQTQKARYLDRLGKPEAADGWHFLVGDAANITRLTDAVGFAYRWDEAGAQYAHPAVLMFLSGEGVITRYMYGIEFAGFDLRNSLIEASQGQIGTTVDRLILYCFQYDPDAGSYVPIARNVMQLAGLLTVIVLGGLLFWFWRREGQRQRAGLQGTL